MEIIELYCKCGNVRAKGSHSYCRPCANAYMRAWRRKHELTVEQRVKDNARSYAGTLLRRGKIQREPCMLCGEHAEMHHPDYRKPRQVIWLCRQHHLDLHAGRLSLLDHRRQPSVQAAEIRTFADLLLSWQSRALHPEDRTELASTPQTGGSTNS